MTEKQRMTNDLKSYASDGGMISKAELARFLGLRKATNRVDRLVADLKRYECGGKHGKYLVSDVAEAIIRTAR